MPEIHDSSDKGSPRSRAKKSSNTILYFFILTVFLLTAGFYFYLKTLAPQEEAISPGTGETSLNANPSGTLSSIAESGIPRTDSGGALPEIKDTSQPSPTSGEEQGADTFVADQQNGPLNSADGRVIATTVDPQTLITQLNTFYTHLDSVAYMKEFNLSQPSKEHFSKLIQKLLDNPPIVTRETDDLFTLLKNTAHFFRILGKKNILILKGILDREKGSFEEILQSFYALTSYPEALNKAYSIDINSNALYDYAGFFLHTMGGRLYLFRRDSNSRMVVSYYAIRIIDDANMDGNSRHGIDIRPGIASLIEEIENGGNTLHMREMYLNKLYDLQEKYN
ncbi:hypothetical protein [Desulforhopalus sp. IMCC35007]|uniref:hypothetical protein n=1 Tax=Desulforhopalus sp. IMCC35007 TaxID=2569543 RepID=UPI0010AE6568|nr:hypothetical protein [Desulforhopalus sp. IMCC35007]TKB10353.1 hypothetical protein FCL48_07345 [Desulforhopalus sp. IMCC35007]